MIAVKATAIVAAACLASACMRRLSAALRHAIVACAMLACAVLPLVEGLAPGWGPPLQAVAAPSSSAASLDVLRGLLTAGAAAAFLTLTAGLIRLARLQARSSRSVPARWSELLNEIARTQSIVRDVALCASPAGTTPMTWGALRPTIFLPEDARAWDDDRLRAVLTHELAHVSRADWLVQIAVTTIAQVFWFNPVFWYASRVIRLEAERACDDAVLNQGADRADYATHLVAIARGVRAAPAAAPAMAKLTRAGMLERRVAAVLAESTSRVPLSAAGTAAVVVMLMAGTVSIAGFGHESSSPLDGGAAVLGVQRDIMMRFGGEERRLFVAARDASLMANRIQGRVELEARLNVDGSLIDVRLVQPVHPDLANAAEAILRQWRREPARIHGVPVEVPIRMTVDFRR